MRKYLILILLSIVCTLHAHEARYILANGMEVYITSLTASPVVRAELCIRGGFSAEEKDTAGFIDISGKLFWSNREGTVKSIHEIGLVQTSSLLTSHASIFGSSFAAFRSEEALSLIRELVSTSIFDDKELDTVLAEYKLEQKEFTDSVYGIIHSLVMEHLYSDSPWKQTQEMSYCYFKEVKREKARSILTDIRNRMYQPDNTALFISAPFTEEQILTLVKKHFESWQGKSSYTHAGNEQTAQEKRAVVFVSDGLPSGLEQYIAVYPAASSGSKQEADLTADTLCFLLNSNTSIFKKRLTENSQLGLEREDYANISFEHHYEQSRIVFQSIMQKTNLPPGKKISEITSLLKEHSSYGDELLRQAYLYKDTFASDQISADKNLSPIQNWAQKNETPEEYLPSSALVQKITAQDPYVFLLLNTNDYENDKLTLQKEQWLVMQEKDLRKKIEQRKTAQVQEMHIERVDSALPDVKILLQNHAQTIKESTTENGITVVVDPSSVTNETSIVLSVDGGILFSNAKKPLVEKAVILHLENTIRSMLYEYRIQGIIRDCFSVNSSPGLTASTISINCSSNDAVNVIEGTARALTFVEIKPSEADELIQGLVSTERMASYDINSQLYRTAVETIYTGTLYEEALVHPDIEAGLYSFSDIQRAITLIFNAGRFSLYVCTDKQTSALIAPAVEANFSYLKQTTILTKNSIEPVFPDMTRWKTLQRIFSTDVSAKDAGERPAKLIPTTTFLDPAHIYIRRPLNEIQFIFDAALSALTRYLSKINDESPASVFETAEIFFDREIPSLCGIRFTRVSSYKDMQKMLASALETYETWLLTDEVLESAKIDRVTRMSTYSGPEGKALVLAEAKTAYGSVFHYLEQYTALESSTLSDLRNVFDQYIKKQTSLWILSADTAE